MFEESLPFKLGFLFHSKVHTMLYDLTVTQFSKMLTNLSQILVKAEKFCGDKKVDVQDLLQGKLADDQFNLTRQVQVACDTAKLAVARLVGQLDSAPKHVDNDASMEELRTRIKEVKEYIESFSKADFSESSERKLKHAYWGDKHLTGYDFALQYATPNMYFHVTTAYAILRNNGVDVGKMEYLGKLPFKG